MATSKSPHAAARRKVTKTLNEIRISISNLRSWWDTKSTVYVPPVERAPGENAYRRDRRPEEYPEAQRIYWSATIDEIDKVTHQLDVLRRHCVEQYNITPAE